MFAQYVKAAFVGLDNHPDNKHLNLLSVSLLTKVNMFCHPSERCHIYCCLTFLGRIALTADAHYRSL